MENVKDIAIRRFVQYGEEKIDIVKAVATTQVAQTALEMTLHWGMVAGGDDGVDSAGRAKMRRLTPDEIVHHACDTAATMWAEFHKRDWLIEVPLPRTEEEIKAEQLENGK